MCCVIGVSSSLFIQPRRIPAYDVVNAKVAARRQIALHVVVPGVIHLFPGHREYGGILFHNVLGLANEGFAPGQVQFMVDLVHQLVELLVVPFRVVLRAIRDIPRVKVVRRIEQRGDNSADRYIKIARLGFVEPHRCLHRAHIGFDVEIFFEHGLEGNGPQFVVRQFPDHESPAP